MHENERPHDLPTWRDHENASRQAHARSGASEVGECAGKHETARGSPPLQQNRDKGDSVKRGSQNARDPRAPDKPHARKSWVMA